MEELIISEQDVINSICLYHAREKLIMPEDVQVELTYEDDAGFGAEAESNGQQTFYKEGNMLAALRIWVEEFLELDPYGTAIRIELHDEEGIIAYVSQ
ncbi:DUF2653 family protein [Kurthia sibirica]|uniref:DUF2653 domain-containing protein n=1 Tax=Kurthia sibirica TaxID=202750 RepID=A0A2U3AMM1_9BACL|nr:DUF2653 family protein [Kurthia sibirica]PWI25766.1 DUF2653 domain-containing protein [Kurthia sibirica]GEK35461.1 hypothetical protein KSI01_29940 [Kurthia sibirica]